MDKGRKGQRKLGGLWERPTSCSGRTLGGTVVLWAKTSISPSVKRLY